MESLRIGCVQMLAPCCSLGTAVAAHTAQGNAGHGVITPLLFSQARGDRSSATARGHHTRCSETSRIQIGHPTLCLYISPTSFCSPVYSTAYKDAVDCSHVFHFFTSTIYKAPLKRLKIKFLY